MNPNTALGSLTATYSDSDDNENDMEIESDSDVNKSDSPSATYNIKEVKNAVMKTKLVSYKLDHDEPAASSDESESILTYESEENSDDELPPKPKGRCAPELQERVASLYEKVKKEGLNLNKFIQERKAFRNPSIYEKLIDYCNLNEYGTNYPPHIYDPAKWGKESYYDELAKVQKAEMDKREKERKDRTKVEFVSGTAKHISNVGGSSGSISISDVSAVSKGLGVLGDGDKRRKTKWDQVSTNSTLVSGSSISIQPVTTTASGTKGTVIPAFGNLTKKTRI